jgi:hypothetical protein
MSTADLKMDLHKFIDTINDNTILKAVHKLLKGQLTIDTPGYLVNGKSISKKEFVKRIEEAEDEISKGDYMTLAALEKESKKW